MRFWMERYFRVYNRGPADIFGWPPTIGNVVFRNRISWVETGGLGYYDSSEKGIRASWKKTKWFCDLLPDRRKLLSQMNITTRSNTPISNPDLLAPDRQILLLRSVEFMCLNLRFSTTSFVDDEAILHLPKLECRDNECNDPVCNHGALKRWIKIAAKS